MLFVLNFFKELMFIIFMNNIFEYLSVKIGLIVEFVLFILFVIFRKVNNDNVVF